MTGLRIVLRGLRDTIDHLMVFIGATFGLWIAIATVVFAPAALLALFHVTDPRHGVETEPPNARAVLRYLTGHFRRSWALGLATIPLLGLLFYNAVFYSQRSGTLAALTPLWVVLFALALMIGLASFAVGGLLDRSAKASLRLGFLITGKALPRFVVVSILTALLTLIGSIMIVPVVLFLPATIAAIVNRLVLSVLDISITDPNAPTPERLIEDKLNPQPKGIGRLSRRR